MSVITAKTIDTLTYDILDVVSEGKEVAPEFIEEFLQDCKGGLIEALQKGCEPKEPTIRMSMLGQPNRKIWYTFNSKMKRDALKPELAISFMYGHIIEAFFMMLAKHAGHTVTRQQEEVTLGGIKGHTDGFIDGVLADIKSASSYGFKKFKDGTILRGNDPYGYIEQLSGYAQALGQHTAALLGVDKSSGELALVQMNEFDLKDSAKRIEEVKAITVQPEPPEEFCYQPIKDGESGNMKLDKPCTWCEYKFECHTAANEGQGLRMFQYSEGIRYLVNIGRMPNVEEIKVKKVIIEEETEST